jgi:hypothetical protein
MAPRKHHDLVDKIAVAGNKKDEAGIVLAFAPRRLPAGVSVSKIASQISRIVSGHHIPRARLHGCTRQSTEVREVTVRTWLNVVLWK